MCGIVGIVGNSPDSKAFMATELLRPLENRGYDAAGVASVSEKHGIQVVKTIGRIDALQMKLINEPIGGSTALGHTRWATHGSREDGRNAHPHLSMNETVAVVHNGTIPNFTDLRKMLESQGFVFKSDTDTEVLAHLIEREHKALEGQHIPHYKFERAVANAFTYVNGDDCAFLATCALYPNEIVAARRQRPLVFGVENGEIYIASDAVALAGKVSRVCELEKGSIATFSTSGIHIEGFNDKDIERLMKPIGINEGEMVLSGYPHWMLREIFEQTDSIARAIAGRIENDAVKLDMLSEYADIWKEAERIYIVACGTSLHAGMIAKLYIECLAKIPVELVIGSEWESAKCLVSSSTPVIGLSQSGNTADVVDSLAEASARGAPIFGITNSPTSQMFGMVKGGTLLKAGHEVAVASTKTFTSQIAVLLLFAVGLSKLRVNGKRAALLRKLTELPEVLKRVLECNEKIQEIAKAFGSTERFIIMGRGMGYPIALEGALKLKEIAYVDAHGHPGGEFKHGHLALVEKGTPVIGMMFADGNEERMLTSLHQAKTSGGSIILFDTTGRKDIAELADWHVALPKVHPLLSPIVAAILLQFLSYWSGTYRGNDVDKPRNLAKSVTVQ